MAYGLTVGLNMFQPRAGGSGGGGSAPGVHRYWRLNITANDGSASFIGLTELRLLNAAGTNVARVASSSTAYASSSDANASNDFPRAFDGNTTTSGWLSATATPPQWIKVDLSGAGLLGPAEIKNFDIYGSHNAPTASPKDFQLQWSDDNVSWTAAKTVTGQTGWTAAQLRSFNVF